MKFPSPPKTEHRSWKLCRTWVWILDILFTKLIHTPFLPMGPWIAASSTPLTEAVRAWDGGEGEVVWERGALALCPGVIEGSGGDFPDNFNLPNVYACVFLLKLRQ